ncbi:MAG: cation:proton antiporter [Rhodospirillaceae bacterium]|mgnify:CR=1 FL=1|nr:cation:proton antiporter [Rhodospirillaceae bacterium]|tara:strand:+ start:1422 stop:1850 length:429 start_codon:yes stop_codon:yes gene_type:complete
MRSYLVLRVVAKLLMPFILVFALYVQFHGDYGPGGGFQAGVIFASGFILYSLIFGIQAAGAVMSRGILRFATAMGLLLYAGVGFYTMLLGGNYLEYDVIAADPTKGQHIGILVIEAGVGITVASVMIAIFFTFAGRRKADQA